MSDIHYRLQFHHDLSPAGWYLGHGVFIENYWLHEVIQGNEEFTFDKSLFFAHNCPKPKRGPRLPALDCLIHQIPSQQDNNALELMEKIPPLSDHPLFKDEYIENFIIQHYANHYESIYMVLNQIALKKHHKDKMNLPYRPKSPLISQALIKDITHIKKSTYMVGGELPYSFDNELPAHEIQLNDFFIANTPVTNGQYLLFLEDNAYENKDLWCTDGWQWLINNNIKQPEYWCFNENAWYAINHIGPYDLNANEPVYGLSHYEANAFAKWAGARLPHEHEWETAARLALLKSTTKVWEWCNNTIYPYEKHQSFPYENSPASLHDNKHYVLKGASQYTRNELKRASYRNHFQAHQRHIFAGLRLVFD